MMATVDTPDTSELNL